MSELRALKILIVDASPIARSTIRALLGRDGSDVLEAEDGERALHVVLTVPLDLILVDIAVPKLDGIGLVLRLRAESTPRLRQMPIVLLASDSNLELAARARSAGATELLQKPLSLEGMSALLRRVRRRRTVGSGAAWPSVRPPIVEEVDGQDDPQHALKRGA
jgi:two-component system chemotaxis response regulator CheY